LALKVLLSEEITFRGKGGLTERRGKNSKRGHKNFFLGLKGSQKFRAKISPF